MENQTTQVKGSLNNHINLSFLGDDVNKIIYYDDLNNSLTIMDKLNKSQIPFTKNEIESLRIYLNNLHDIKIQNKIKDSERDIKQYQTWIKDCQQQLIKLENQINDTQKQLDEAFTNKSLELINQLHKKLNDLQTNKNELNNKINTYQENISNLEKENQKLNLE